MFWLEESVVVVLSAVAEGEAVACLINIESVKPKTVDSSQGWIIAFMIFENNNSENTL